LEGLLVIVGFEVMMESVWTDAHSESWWKRFPRSCQMECGQMGHWVLDNL